MSFLRAQWRAVLGAGGLGLMIPGALLLALAVTTTLGGTGLPGLRQVVEGPAVPQATRTVEAAEALRDAADSVGPAIPQARSARVRAASPAAARPADRTPATRRRTTTRRERTTRPAPAPRRPATTPTAPPAVTTPPATTPTTPAPPAETNPVRRIVKRVNEDVVEKLPVVGKPAADVVQTVVDLLVPPPSATRAVVPAAPAPAVPAPAPAPAPDVAAPAVPAP